MSWSAKTWQPAVRRDGPLVVAAAFFLLPGLFYIGVWYSDYFPGSGADIAAAVTAAIALVAPALICFRLASRAGRRKALWSILVLSGSIMSLWLPVQYLIRGGPLPPSAYVALPDSISRVLATTFVSAVPLLMGMIPVVLYGLAPGQDRPLVGIPPRSAVFLTAICGVALWTGTLFLSLLNPTVPPFVALAERVEAAVSVTRPPALPGEMVPATWAALLWRLHDGSPPGATEVRREEGSSLRLQLPAAGQREDLVALLMGRGAVEFVDAGDSPPAAGTTASTTTRPLPGADETFETVLTDEHFMQNRHWSGVHVREITVEKGNDAAVLVIRLSEEGQAMLEQLGGADRTAFMSLVVDNVAFISFPALGAIEENTLVVRRLEPEIADALAAIIRYGPLELVPEFALAR